MKKSLTAFCICTALMAMLVLGASAQEGKCGKKVTWTLEDGTLTISGTGAMYDYEPMSTEIVSPLQKPNYSPWYAQRASVKKVVVNEGVTVIGEAAFHNCNKLELVQLPEGITELKKDAFSYCDNLKEILLPTTLSKIGEMCFAASGLTIIHIPANVSSMPGSAFYKSNLKTITVDKKNKYYVVFEDVLFDKKMQELICYPSRLMAKEYMVPDGVTSIMPYAFSGIWLETLKVPASVTTIEDSAFSYCARLKTFYFPKNVKSIGEQEFYKPSEITIYGDSGSAAQKYAKKQGITFLSQSEVEEPFTWEIDDTGTLTVRGKGALSLETFDGSPWEQEASKIKAIHIEEGIHGISGSVFDGLFCVTEISLPASLQQLEAEAFKKCVCLESIILSKKNEYFYIKDGVLFHKTNNALVLYPPQREGDMYSVPSGIVTIEAYAFCSAQIQEIRLPSTVQKMNNAFVDCDYLSIAIYGQDSKTIKAPSNDIYALYVPDTGSPVAGFSAPKHTVIYSEKAPPRPFVSENIYYLDIETKEVAVNQIHSLVHKYGYSFVEGFPSLGISWTLKDGVLTISGIGKMPDYEKGKTPWANKKDTIHTVIVEEGVTKIGNYAFYGLSSLVNVELPRTLVGIGTAAFACCTELLEICIPEKVKHIDAVPFYGCTDLSEIRVEEDNINFTAKGSSIYSKEKNECLWKTEISYSLRDVVYLLSKKEVSSQNRAKQMLETLAW